jgi:two-component system, OmpR family, phosphate regulon sensor histidine kinase PhoR
MRTPTPHRLAVLTALAASILAALVLVFAAHITGKMKLLVFAFSILLLFAVVYAIVYRWTRNFIFETINPIYKTIRNVDTPEKELRKTLESKAKIEEVENEALAWTQKRAFEINRLKELEKYRREFLGNVSHELKTPIFNIQGYVLTLLDGGLEDGSINRLYLEKTEKSINRMISIVEDLESIARLESGELQLNPEVFDITELFREVFELLEMKASAMDIRLLFAHRYDRPVYVEADRKKIFEAVNNLLVNSIHYGIRQGKTTVAFLDMGDHILVEITDTGIGIEEKDLPRIFERFYRTDRSRSRDLGGTGLGLAIVKHIIEAHRQTILVRSKPGFGTAFTFTLKKGEKPLHN